MNHEIEIQLSTLGTPFSYEEHPSDDNTYIVYSEYDNRPLRHADNEEIVESYYYQFDIFSKGNYKSLEKELKVVLKEIGGARLSSFSNKEAGYYQKTIRYRFDREI